VKHAVKRGLTQRLRQRVGMGDSDSSDEEKDAGRSKKDLEEATEDGEATLREDGMFEKDYASEKLNKAKSSKRGRKDLEQGGEANVNADEKAKKTGLHLLPKAAASMTSMSMLEQSMPADAVLTKEGANEVWN
jgi:metal transporter CNNM